MLAIHVGKTHGPRNEDIAVGAVASVQSAGFTWDVQGVRRVDRCAVLNVVVVL